METIALPEVNFKTNVTLLEALKSRKSCRQYSDKDIDFQDLSNILWAANGVNRTENAFRTSPSAMNYHPITIYALCKRGVFMYDHLSHTLVKTDDKDHRAITGYQDFVKNAPVEIVLVADHANMQYVEAKFKNELESGLMSQESISQAKQVYAAYDAGHISQNIYLYACSVGLSAVTRLAYDHTEVANALNLPENKKITLILSVGYSE